MRIKKLRCTMCIVLTILIVMMSSVITFAVDDVELVYNGESKTFEAELGKSFNYNGMMPGDSETQTIKLRNDSEGGFALRMVIKKVLNEDLLGNFNLTITETKAGSSMVIFDGAVSKLLDGDVVTLSSQEFEDGLEHYYFQLNDYLANDEGELEFVLSVPEELGNEYQRAEGSMTWALYVYPATVLSETEEEPGETPVVLSAIIEVATGDKAPIFWIAVSSVTILIIAVVLLGKKRSNKRRQV